MGPVWFSQQINSHPYCGNLIPSWLQHPNMDKLYKLAVYGLLLYSWWIVRDSISSIAWCCEGLGKFSKCLFSIGYYKPLYLLFLNPTAFLCLLPLVQTAALWNLESIRTTYWLKNSKQPLCCFSGTNLLPSCVDCCQRLWHPSKMTSFYLSILGYQGCL